MEKSVVHILVHIIKEKIERQTEKTMKSETLFDQKKNFLSYFTLVTL